MDDIPISHSELDLVKHCNDLLAHVGLDVKHINSYKELTRAAPSLLVAVYESLFQERLGGIIRSPVVASDYANNAQCVIDGLSNQIQMGLQHISGESVAKGELRSLTNVIDIMRRIVSITGASRLGGHGGIVLSEEDRLASGSISTRDSFFEESSEINGVENKYLLHGYRTGSPVQRDHSGDRGLSECETKKEGKRSNTGSRLRAARKSTLFHDFGRNSQSKLLRQSSLRKKNIAPEMIFLGSTPSFSAAGIKLESTSALFLQEKKLALAKRRREHELACRGNRARAANRNRLAVSQKAFQRRWSDDRIRETEAFEMRRNNENIVLQRKIYQSIVNQIGELRITEYAQTKEILLKAKADAECHIESLQNLFRDKMKLLREQEDSLRNQDKEALKVERLKTIDYVEGAQNERQQHLILQRQRRLAQKRDKELHRVREETLRVMSSIHKLNLPHQTRMCHGEAGGREREICVTRDNPSKPFFGGRKPIGDGIALGRPEILIELDKQVCDLVRQQQHASLSYGMQKGILSGGRDSDQNDENNPVDNENGAHNSTRYDEGDNSVKPMSIPFPEADVQRRGRFLSAPPGEVNRPEKLRPRARSSRSVVPVKVVAWK